MSVEGVGANLALVSIICEHQECKMIEISTFCTSPASLTLHTLVYTLWPIFHQKISIINDCIIMIMIEISII
jgi:hypothetical protein